MTFLNPAILWGLLAVSVPIIIHIFNLKRTKKIEFSTLMFIKEIQQNQYKKIRLKQLLILLCRIAMVIFLVLAFSRPLQTGYLGSIGSKARSSVLLILDNSFSMETRTQFTTGGGTCFDEAKGKLSETVDLLDETDEVYFTTTSDISKPTGAVIYKDLSELKDSISSARISDITRNFDEVQFYADKIIQNTSNAYKEVFLFTDGQKSAFGEFINKNIAEINKDGKIKFNIIIIGNRKPNNVSLDTVDIVTKILEKNRKVRLKCTIKNHNPFNALNKSVVLSATVGLSGSKHKDEKVIDIPANSSVDVEFSFTPGVTGFSGGYIEVLQNEITDDEIASDNRRYFVFKVPEKVKVLLISPTPNDFEFVKLALSSSEELLRDTLNRQVNYFEITQNGENELSNRYTTDELRNFDCIVFSNKQSFSNIEADKLYEYIQNGGGIIVYCGPNLSTQNYNETIIPRFDLPPLGSEFGKPDGSESYIFNEIDFKHPVFEGIFKQSATGGSSDPKYFTKESPKIKFGINLNTGKNSIPLIKLNNGTNFLVEYNSGKGKLLFYSVSPDFKYSDFPLKNIFSPITVRVIMYLANNNPIKEATTGRDYFFDITDQSVISISDSLLLSRTTLPAEIKVTELQSQAGLINFKPYLNNSSIYKLSAGKSIVYEFSCNFEKKESETEKLNADEIEKILTENYGIKPNIIAPEEKVNASILELRTGREIWQYCLILVILFFALEFYLSRSLMKI